MHKESESITEESDIAEGCTTTVCSDKIQSKAVRNAADDRGTEAQQGCLPACSIEQHVLAHVLPCWSCAIFSKPTRCSSGR